MMKVCIVYGWAEGPWQGKKLRKLLRDRGFRVVRDAKSADIIIAHSGGCYMLPHESKAKQIVLVGLPYWPRKHPLQSLREKVRLELKDLWWYKKTLFNTYYFASRPRRWMRMARSFRQRTLPTHESASVVAVRNEQDVFMHPTESIDLIESLNWKLTILPGTHDDLWSNPMPYVDLIS